MKQHILKRSVAVLCLILSGLFLIRSSAFAAAGKEKIPTFVADVSKVPDLQPWGLAAESLCRDWYPKISVILRTDDKKRSMPPLVKLVFEKMDGVAYSNGTEIHISADWVKKQPMDFGMVIHELTHIVQRYPNYKAGWLVEGIADYVRHKHFETLIALPKIDFTRAKYTDAYKTTAHFLIFLESKYGEKLVPELNAALLAGKYEDDLFVKLTGKALPDLWLEFKDAK